MVIGPANDFWRLRLTRMEPADELDFRWHEDILWRQPNVTVETGEPAFVIEAVSVETTPEEIVPLAAFADEAEARSFLADVQFELSDMTKSQFEAAYFRA